MISYKYFTEDELRCKCGCGKADMDSWFMDLLEEIREEVGEPFIVTSAYRCPEYNNKVSSTGLGGPHTTGRAIDIKANSSLKYKISIASYKEGITRFGIGKSFIHIDNLKEVDLFTEEVIWTY